MDELQSLLEESLKAKEALDRAKKAVEDAKRKVAEAKREAEEAESRKATSGHAFLEETKKLAQNLQANPEGGEESSVWINVKPEDRTCAGDIWSTDWSYSEVEGGVDLKVPCSDSSATINIEESNISILQGPELLFRVHLNAPCHPGKSFWKYTESWFDMHVKLERPANQMDFEPWAKFLVTTATAATGFCAIHGSSPMTVFFGDLQESCAPKESVTISFAVQPSIPPNAGSHPQETDTHECCHCLPCENDYIAVYNASKCELREHFDVQFTDGTIAGAATFMMPSMQGAYCFAYVSHRSGILARTDSVAVTTKPVPKAGHLTTSLVAQHSRPYFFVERLTSISVYQVYVAFSPLEWSTPDASTSEPLPVGWRPGFRVTNQDNQGVLELEFQVGPAKLAERLTLRLRFPNPLDERNATCSIQAGCIVFRLQLKYPGSLSTRPKTLIQQSELYFLSRNSTHLSCAFCRAPLLKRVDPRYRVCVLPSEDWTEWSEFWMCHPHEQNLFMPAKEYSALPRTLLVGETWLQLDDGDCCSIKVSPTPSMADEERSKVLCSRCSSCLGYLGPSDTCCADAGRVGPYSIFKDTLFCPDSTGRNIFAPFAAYVEVASRLVYLTSAHRVFMLDIVANAADDVPKLQVGVLTTVSQFAWSTTIDDAVELAPAVKVRYRLIDACLLECKMHVSRSHLSQAIMILEATNKLLPHSTRNFDASWKIGYLPLKQVCLP